MDLLRSSCRPILHSAAAGVLETDQRQRQGQEGSRPPLQGFYRPPVSSSCVLTKNTWTLDSPQVPNQGQPQLWGSRGTRTWFVSEKCPGVVNPPPAPSRWIQVGWKLL